MFVFGRASCVLVMCIAMVVYFMVLLLCLHHKDLIDHCLHHWGDSVPPGGVCSLRQHHEGQPHLSPGGGGALNHATVGHLCHRLLHQLCHHHDSQPYV